MVGHRLGIALADQRFQLSPRLGIKVGWSPRFVSDITKQRNLFVGQFIRQWGRLLDQIKASSKSWVDAMPPELMTFLQYNVAQCGNSPPSFASAPLGQPLLSRRTNLKTLAEIEAERRAPRQPEGNWRNGITPKGAPDWLS